MPLSKFEADDIARVAKKMGFYAQVMAPSDGGLKDNYIVWLVFGRPDEKGLHEYAIIQERRQWDRLSRGLHRDNEGKYSVGGRE